MFLQVGGRWIAYILNKQEALSLRSYLPTGIADDDAFINAFIADTEGNGAVGNEITEAAFYIDYVSRKAHVDDLIEDELGMVIRTFLGMLKRNIDNDAEYLRYFQGIMRRGGAPVFGTRTDIVEAFRHILPFDVKIYLVEYTDETNILMNPDFALFDRYWTLSGFAELSTMVSFCNMCCAYIYGLGGTVHQQFRAAQAGIHIVHVFIMGRVAVTLRNEAGLYWDSEAWAWDSRGHHLNLVLEFILVDHGTEHFELQGIPAVALSSRGQCLVPIGTEAELSLEAFEGFKESAVSRVLMIRRTSQFSICTRLSL